MKTWSNNWKSSTQPRKQRKYVFNAPLHVKGKLLHANLSKDLRVKYKIRSIRIRTGDKVKVLRGQFKGKEGKIEKVMLKDSKVYISKVEVQRLDGSNAKIPIHASNLQVLELELNDKKRVSKLKSD